MCRIANLAPLKSFVLAAALLGTALSRAQLTDVVVGKRFYIDKVYAGLLATTPLTLDQTPGTAASSIQSGARIGLWLVPNILKVRTFGAIRGISGQKLGFLKSYEAIFVPTPSLEVKMGVMATPTTELRPNPISWQSQVETHAESTIPGGKPGIKIRYQFAKDMGITYGVHRHEGITMYHLKLASKRLAIASFLGDDAFFIAAKWTYKRGNLLVTHGKSKTSVSSLIPIAKRHFFYLDMEYNDAIGKLVFGEWGLRKRFEEAGMFNGFFSVNYNNQLRVLQGGFFLHM